MSKSEMIKWLQNLKKDIGQSQHQDLWHYAEILDEVIDTIEVSEDAISREYMLKLQRELHGWMPNDKSQELWQKIKDAPTVVPQVPNGDAISREVATDIIKNYDFKFPQYMERFVTELRDAMKKDLVEDIENAPSVIPTNENEIKICRNCDNAYLYQDCLYCDEIEEETEIEPDDACSLWKLRESSVKPKEGEWINYCQD